MSRILGTIPQALVGILDIDGGRILVDRLNDQEGVHLVYDISQIAQGELLSLDDRLAEMTLASGGTESNSVAVGDLPRVYRVLGANVTCSSVTNLSRVSLLAQDWGTEAAPAGGDLLLWHWFAGASSGRSLARPTGADSTRSQAVWLLPDYSILPIGLRSYSAPPLRQGVRNLLVSATSTTATSIDFQVTFHLGFYIGQTTGTGRSVAFQPSW